ncbi:MAG: protein adenylyltransferase SelO [Archangium sp.]
MTSFSSRFAAHLPGDPLVDNSPRPVRGALWSPVAPTPVSNPRLIFSAPDVAELLGITDVNALLPVLSGNAPPPGGKTFAANYGGHQFGHWAGQLGDGRAIGLGEVNGYELQLKGAGPTPYSRRADGRAVLRSSIREFLCSEAMHHLGVPTTRALSLVATGDTVVRDMFYDGNPEAEPGAIVCRVAPSFIRFGNFELPASREDKALLQQLFDFVRTNYFAQLDSPEGVLIEVATRTAKLIAQWQAVGFVHGVMNTDNMSILGLTIDYGPYGWVDDFDAGWTPNTTDAQQRRYRYGNQPGIGLWNIERLGVALMPLMGDDEKKVEAALLAYEKTYGEESSRLWAQKLGVRNDAELPELAHGLFNWLGEVETDMTLFFRALSKVAVMEELVAFPAALKDAFYAPPSDAHLARGLAWLQRWWKLARENGATPAKLDAVNPKYVLRNWLAQEAIDAAHAGDDSKVRELYEVMRTPFAEQPGREHYAQKRPEWARNKPGCSALSCSS